MPASKWSLKADAQAILDLASAFYGSAILFAASDLGLFSEISRMRSVTAQGISADLGLDPKSTLLFLDACVALGLLDKDGENYRNSPQAETYLVPGSAFDISTFVRENREAYPAWSRLTDFIRSGKPEPPHVSPELDSTTAAVLAMHARALSIGRSVVRRLDLGWRRKLLDVGGGSGTYSAMIALEFPQVHCTVLDRPEVVKIAAALLAQQGASKHVDTLEGDYHTTPFPEGNDAVLFFGVLHAESVDSILNLLRRAADSLRPNGLVYVLDTMTDETHTLPVTSALSALHQALTTGDGFIFSYTELKHWMESFGLCDFNVEALPSPAPYWLAKARKPG